jgi:hypothetical protein
MSADAYAMENFELDPLPGVDLNDDLLESLIAEAQDHQAENDDGGNLLPITVNQAKLL